ncbi:hypothetical protein EPUL_000575, partial [Erysiphe pulchra]
PSQTYLTSKPALQPAPLSISKPNSIPIHPSFSQPISQPITPLISQPIFQIGKCITHICVAAKQLVETLKKWSQLQATNVQVSDIYVRIGNEFNLACRVFTAIDIDTSDIQKFLVLLRIVLETTLSQEPSIENLEKYLTRIQGTITNLLHWLKSKQQKIRHNRVGNIKSENLKQISTGSGIITSLGSFTVDNSAIKNDIQMKTEDRASTPTNHVVIYHNISTSFLRTAKNIQDQAPLVTTKEKNCPTLPPSQPVSLKNSFTAMKKNGNLSIQDSKRCLTLLNCYHRQASPTNFQSSKSNQIENLSSLEDKKQSLSSSPQPTEDLTLFLQYKTKVKKFLFSGSCSALTMAKLQQAFIEKFAWNTHHNGVDLPDIYIQDPKSGIRHELEDLSDIKDQSVLVLNVEALDEVKRQIDDGFCGMKKIMENIKSVVDDQQATIQRVSDRQQDTIEELFQIQKVISPMTRECNYRTTQKLNCTSFEADVKKSLNAVRKLSESLNATVSNKCLSEAANNRGRKCVDDGKKKINEECDKIVARVDDLQDTVNDLRKEKMELERVCNDQEDVNKIEDLIQELEDDVAKTSQPFALVEEETKERSKYPEAPKIAGRAISRGFSEISMGNSAVAKEDLLDEVRELLSYHEDRLEAIERAEKLRARELEAGNVSEFEDQGKLLKSGGYEKVKR